MVVKNQYQKRKKVKVDLVVEDQVEKIHMEIQLDGD